MALSVLADVLQRCLLNCDGNPFSTEFPARAAVFPRDTTPFQTVHGGENLGTEGARSI